ncbi:MAG: Transcriptional activator of fatty acid utilization [Phylliscum demangeonii]|nr:MAG: Transcriptional activator of fatty acid utilization [Phylliscum demangeonii]
MNPVPGVAPLVAPSSAELSRAAIPGLTTAPAPAPNSQTPGHPSFRRQRASKACEVRCDATSLGVPCTNCVAFVTECKIPLAKKKRAAGRAGDVDSEPADGVQDHSSATVSPVPLPPHADGSQAQHGHPHHHPPGNSVAYTDFIKPKFARAPIKEAGRVAYLGESTNLSLLVPDRHGSADNVHYPLPEHARGSEDRLKGLSQHEWNLLDQGGAFLLPPRVRADELVDLYFTWVAPVVPVISRSRFMRQYRDEKNPPSRLLLNAIFLAGSRVCWSPQMKDETGSTSPVSATFYQRAKALYDANYEDDRVTIVQALVLMGWYWEAPEDVTRNVFYWTGVAVVVAQGSGMHRRYGSRLEKMSPDGRSPPFDSVERSPLSRADKRLWKRIWWTLFNRDRSVAVALGRPMHINTDDSDVEMVTEDDFLEDEDGQPADYAPDRVHVQFFLQYVKLCEIMGLVLSQQYSVASKGTRRNAMELAHSDMALADWLQNCPKDMCWEPSRHHFWSAVLHSNY